jgi:hypothetical protein
MGVTDLSAGELAHRLRYGRSVPGIPVVKARLQGQPCVGVGRTSRRYWSCACGVSSALAADLAGVDGPSARRAHTPPTGILPETSGCCLLESPHPVGAASSIKQASVFSHSLFLAAALSQTPSCYLSCYSGVSVTNERVSSTDAFGLDTLYYLQRGDLAPLENPEWEREEVFRGEQRTGSGRVFRRTRAGRALPKYIQ